MKNKSKLLFLSGLLALSLQLNAAGTITGPGWYYPAYHVGTTPSYANNFLKGAYGSQSECNQVKWLDYDPSDGVKPWDGGAGCHYIYAGDVGVINDIYSLIYNPGSDTIIGLEAEELQEVIQQIKEINEAHDIANYKTKMNRLIDSISQEER